VKVVEIEGAEQEIRPSSPTDVSIDEHDRIEDQYLSLLFGT